ncbi:membrane protein [Sulfolobales archaeon HS-7]|nr:membrane protein [Sulfolobales archaeon HS-7]
MKLDFDTVIGNILRIGVIISGVLLAIGAAEIFIHGGAQGYSLSQIASVHSIVNTSTASVYKIPPLILKGDGLALIYLGLIVLIATPVIRVLASVINFGLERDKLYTIITAIVLFNLLFAIFLLPLLVK